MITLFIADQITEQKSLVPNHNSLYFDVFWVHRFQSGWESSIFYISLYIYGTILYNLVATLARKRMAGPRFPTHGRTLWLVRSGQIATAPRLGNGSSLLVFSSLDLSNECFYLHRHNIALHWMRSPLEWMGPFHVIFSHFSTCLALATSARHCGQSPTNYWCYSSQGAVTLPHTIHGHVWRMYQQFEGMCCMPDLNTRYFIRSVVSINLQ